jgi:hypothetical protein
MRYFTISLLFVVGCAIPKKTTWECHSKDFWNHIPEIIEEVERKFDNAHILMCHGADYKSQWHARPDDARLIMPMQKVVDGLLERYPDRPIVLWCCNQKGYKVKGDRVHYFISDVWLAPDIYARGQFSKGVEIPFERIIDIDTKYAVAAGSIEEAIQGK